MVGLRLIRFWRTYPTGQGRWQKSARRIFRAVEQRGTGGSLRSVRRHLRATNIVLSGLVAGGDVGSLVAVNPSLKALPDADRMAASKVINPGFGRIMQPLVIAQIVTGVSSVLLTAREPSSAAFKLGVGATACNLAMLAITLRGIAPINAQMQAADDYATYSALRERWDQRHRARVALEVAGLALAASASAALEP
jgi:hypothetical protein